MRITPVVPVLGFLSFLAAPLLAQETVEEQLRPSVVQIRNDECFGSGMFLDAQGLILTNAHVACSPLPYRVLAVAQVGGSAKEVTFTKVKLLGFHPEYDLALLRIDPAELGAAIKPVTLARSAPVTGDRVWAVGFPADHDRGKSKVATWGEMRSLNRDFFGVPYLAMDISIYHGNSGGPLCNEKGQVIGVITALDGTGALAVPISAFNPEKFGPLKARVPNREMSSRLLEVADELLKSGGRLDPSMQVMSLYETALLWDNGNAALYAMVGQMCLRCGRFPAAVAYITRSLQMQPWPDKAEIYRSLGYALISLRKKDEALAIWREGLEKFPLDNADLWGEIAAALDKERRSLEAAISARLALKTFSGHAGDMNDIYRRSQAALGTGDLAKLREVESDLDGHLARLRATAEKARREGRNYLNVDAERVIATMADVQQESLSPGLDRIEVGKRAPLKMSDEELEIRFIRGRIEVAKEHLRDGRQEKAIEILEDVIKTYPANPETEAARLALKVFKRG